MSDTHITCAHCGRTFPDRAPGTRHRNHCPHCLWSLHVAETRGQDDRRSRCYGGLEPIAIAARRDGEWTIVHRCEECGALKTNRVAGDDDALLLLCLALRPLQQPPFPLDQLPLEVAARYRQLGGGEGDA